MAAAPATSWWHGPDVPGCASWSGNPVNALAKPVLAGAQCQAQLLLEGSGKGPAYRVRLPACGLNDLADGGVDQQTKAEGQAVSTILYDGKPEYYAIMVTHPDSGIKSVADLKGRTFAFGDKGSTSGYLIPLHYFMTQGINPAGVDGAMRQPPKNEQYLLAIRYSCGKT